jgi:hypothetical protein
MVQWKKIDHLEKIMSKYIIIFFEKYEIIDNFDEDINVKSYGTLSFKKNDNDLIINFKDCVLKNRFILNKSKKDICCVCYDECGMTLNCGHYLCDACLRSWLLINNSCPMCRSQDNCEKGFDFIIPIKLLEFLFSTTKCYDFILTCSKKKNFYQSRKLFKILQKSRNSEDPLKKNKKFFRYKMIT